MLRFQSVSRGPHALLHSIGKRLRDLTFYEAAEEQIEAVRRITPNTLFGNLMSGTAVLVASWNVLPHEPLVGWYLYLVLTCAMIFVHYRRTITGTLASPRQEARKIVLWSAALATPWAIISVCTVGRLSHESELVLFAALAAMASNGAIYRAPVPPAAITYVSLMLLPIIAKAISLDGLAYQVLAGLITGYVFFLASTIRTSANQWRQRSDAHALNAELIANYPGGVVMLDENHHVLLMNDAARTLLHMSPAAEVIARNHFVGYLASPALADLASDEARNNLRAFRRALLSRRKGTFDIAFDDDTAITIVGIPTAQKRYLAVLQDMTAPFREAKRLAASASRDPLTQVYNRAGLQQHLNAACARREPIALLAVDLDKFKEANDRYGHAAGDAVLIEVATRLTIAVREDDIVARVGGDEFIIVLRSLPDVAGCVSNRLEAEIAKPVAFEGHVISIGASVGFACSGDDGETPAELMRKADEALYRAKRSRQHVRDNANAA